MKSYCPKPEINTVVFLTILQRLFLTLTCFTHPYPSSTSLSANPCATCSQTRPSLAPRWRLRYQNVLPEQLTWGEKEEWRRGNKATVQIKSLFLLSYFLYLINCTNWHFLVDGSKLHQIMIPGIPKLHFLTNLNHFTVPESICNCTIRKLFTMQQWEYWFTAKWKQEHLGQHQTRSHLAICFLPKQYLSIHT